MGLFSIFKKGDILYYPGCRTYVKHEESIDIYKRIFSKLGINIITLEELEIPKKHFCCGLVPLELGYEQEARKLARENMEFLKANNIKRIMTNCPSCFKMLTQNYPEMMPDWDIEVINTWKLILERLIAKQRLIKKKYDEQITFHDSCYLARHCSIYNIPRKILELLGYEIIEMYDSKDKAICCGSCGGLTLTNPELADKIATQRVFQAKRAKAKRIIVTSFDNYDLLKRNSADVEVTEISEILAEALGIKIKKIIEGPLSEEEEIILDLKTDQKIKEEIKEDYLDDELEDDLI